MALKIAIASGKGGTGKTTVAVNLLHYLSKKITGGIQLVDCDVEEPNDLIFLSEIAIPKKTEKISQPIPGILSDRCTFCRKCVEFCEFNAIVVIPPAGFAEVNSGLCHSCGACLVACPENALSESLHEIGVVNHYKLKDGQQFIEGKLAIGSAMQTMLIRELKKRVNGQSEIVLYDAPPGTSCPVVETIADVDYVVLVTEPTPFGLHDLELMVELLEKMDKPYGVIVNKAGLGNRKIYDFISIKKIELLGEIPFDKEYAHYYSSGNLLGAVREKMRSYYRNIIENLDKKITVYEGNNYFKW